MDIDLTDLRFQDVDEARAWLEAQRWPHGVSCPHCGNSDQAKLKALRGKAHRPGLYQCAECRKQFTVTVGTVMERSKIPLNKWVLAMHLMSASAKGISARRLLQLLGVTYQTAWFLCRRIREAMADQKRLTKPMPMKARSPRRTKTFRTESRLNAKVTTD
jgi:transposase-like protein